MNPIKEAQEKCDLLYQEMFDHIVPHQGGFIVGEKGGDFDNCAFDLGDILDNIHSRDRAIIEAITIEIQRMETRCPEYESNDYDSGAFDFRAKVLKMLDDNLK